MNIDDFNNKFNVSGEFKQIELEDAIIKKFGSIQYHYFKPWKEETDFHEIINHPASYTCGTKYEWGSNEIETNYSQTYSNRQEALITLLIEHYNQFKSLVNKVYEV